MQIVCMRVTHVYSRTLLSVPVHISAVVAGCMGGGDLKYSCCNLMGLACLWSVLVCVRVCMRVCQWGCVCVTEVNIQGQQRPLKPYHIHKVPA